MITKAIIENLGQDEYHFQVRIPIFHKIANAPGATPSKELPIASVCFAPGCKPNLTPGDVVYVAFENNQYSSPVIIGMLLNSNYVGSSASLIADSLEASVDVNFPDKGVTFGKTLLTDILDSLVSVAGGGDLTKAEFEALIDKIKELYLQ